MRVTENMRFDSVQRSLSELRSRQADVTNQISSGRRVLAPSDDPVAAAQLTRLSASSARTTDYRNTIGTVRSDTSLSEATLSQASQLMVRAHELAVQGANGSFSADDRNTMAAEVVTLQEQLVAMANTRGTRGYLFSGSQTSTPALTSGGQYQGDSNVQEVEISPGVTVGVTVTGDDAFGGPSGTNAFAALETLRQGLVSNDTSQITSSLDTIEASRSQIVRTQSKAGLIMNRLDAADEALSLTGLEYDKQSSQLGEVDPFEAIGQLTQLTTSLQQAIAVARQTLSSDSNLF